MLDEIHAALSSTGYPFAHFGWSHAPTGDYGVYSEDGSDDFFSDDGHGEQSLTGTIDLFTRDDSDTPRIAVETALASLENCAWYLNSVQFESESGYIHLEWAFEVV